MDTNINSKGCQIMDKFFHLVDPKNDWEPFIYCDADFSSHNILIFFDSHYTDVYPSCKFDCDNLGLEIAEGSKIPQNEDCDSKRKSPIKDTLSPYIEGAIKTFCKDVERTVLSFDSKQYFVCRSRSWLEEHQNETSTDFYRQILNSYRCGSYDDLEKAFRQRCNRTLLPAYKRLLYSDYLSKEEMANMNFVLENAFLPGFIFLLKEAKKSSEFFNLLTRYIRKNRGELHLKELEKINNLKLTVVLLNNLGYQKFYPRIEPIETTVDITDPMQAKGICEEVLIQYEQEILNYVSDLNANNAKAIELFKKYFDDTAKKLERYVYNRSYGLFTSSSPDYFAMLAHLYAIRVAVDNFDTKYSRKYKKYYLRD